jgi:hypothetical protein
MPLEDGATFAGHTIIRLLGSGGMGDVYLIRTKAISNERESAYAAPGNDYVKNALGGYITSGRRRRRCPCHPPSRRVTSTPAVPGPS